MLSSFTKQTNVVGKQRVGGRRCLLLMRFHQCNLIYKKEKKITSLQSSFEEHIEKLLLRKLSLRDTHDLRPLR